MSRHPLFLSALGALLLVAGCAATTPSETTGSDAAEASVAEGGEAFIPQSARVFVEGRDEGLTPTTVRVRRSFGESEVTLVASGETERTYLIQRTASADSRSLDYSYWDGANDSNTFDATTLPRTKSGAFVVPYSPHAITIQDRQYNLVLLVTE